MSGKKQTESQEQLLQDASTLLMFANVAAKQQQEINKLSPSPPPGSQPPSQGHSATQSQASSQHQSPHQAPNEPVQAPPPVHVIKHTVFDPVRQVYINSPNLKPPPLVQPQIQPVIQLSHNKPYLPSVFQPLGYSQQHPHVSQPPKLPSLPTSHTQSQPSHILSNATANSSLNVSQYPISQNPTLTQPHIAIQNQNRPNPVPIRPAVSNNVLKSEPSQPPVVAKEQTTPVTQHASPNITPSSGSNIESFPEKGHKRTNSVPSTAKLNHALSPGPASVVLSRGIDNETGKPNNSNAIIAAAALAQAADNPLPLLKREEARKLQLKMEEEEKSTHQQLITTTEIKKPESAAVEQDSIMTQEFKVPPLEEYRVEPDSGVIGCICGIPDDDGFTIQCDLCHRWQHCLCMDYKTNEEVPEEDDEYQCYFCDKNKWGKFNAEKCRKDTIARLQQDNDNDDNDNDSKTKRKSLGSAKAEDKKKRKLESEKNKERRKQLRDDFNSTETHEEYPDFVPSKDNELFTDNTAENYQSTYYKLRNNDYRNHEFQRQFEQLGKDFYKSYLKLSEEEKAKIDIKVTSLREFKATPKMYIRNPNHEKYLQEKDSTFKVPNTFIQVKTYSDSQKQKFNGISKLSLFIQVNKDEKPEEFEEVIPKGTPILEYFGVLDLFTNYRDNKTNQYHIWGTTKPKVLKVSLDLVNEDCSISKTDVILDSRFVGNETRFLRKACPLAVNCEIKKYYIPETCSFRFMVVTSKDITLTHENYEEELRLIWEWDENHPILKLNSDESKDIEGLKVDQLPKSERAMLMNTIDNILYFTECGCSTSSSSPLYVPNCNIFKVKKAMTYMLRSTRKISGIMSANAHKAKEELITSKDPEPFISWEERLEERDQIIQGKLYITSTQDSTSEGLVDDIKGETLRQAMLDDKVKQLNDSPFKEVTIEEVKEDVLNLFALSSKVTEEIEKSVEEEVTVKPEIKRSLNEIKLKIKDNNLEKINEVLKMEVEKLPVPVKEDKPVVKKKLSFADYKKKMK